MHLKDLNEARVKPESKLPYRILLVDDEPQISELYSEVLNLCGYNVDIASNGIVAWNTLIESSYDLLITDNDMPRLTGLDLIKKVRFSGMTLPIILASGSIQMEGLNKNPIFRIDAILFKPLSFDELLVTVDKVLNQSGNEGKQGLQTVG
jgi:two-component system, OmpR family, alkaline phosphatase synthesis response regulator PhoP